MVSEQKINKEIYVNLLWSLSTEKKNGKKEASVAFQVLLLRRPHLELTFYT